MKPGDKRVALLVFPFSAAAAAIATHAYMPEWAPPSALAAKLLCFAIMWVGAVIVLGIPIEIIYHAGVADGRAESQAGAARERERVEEWRAANPGPRAPAP